MTDAPYAAERVSYEDGSLTEADLAATPLLQLERWYADAVVAARAGVLAEPNAMVLATADAEGAPAVRTVLLKGLDAAGLRLFTNLGSRKARHLAVRPDVALLLGWHPMQRQVAVRGRVEQLGRAEAEDYFRTRPYGSRIGAWASTQSEVAAGRGEIEARAQEMAERFPDTGSADDVPLPEHWGGYLVRPYEVEFWQGRRSRLHDRLVYLADAPAALDDGSAWRVERRWP